jgi:hypothetical protein
MSFLKTSQKTALKKTLNWVSEYLPSLILFIVFIVINFPIIKEWMNGTMIDGKIKVIILFIDVIIALSASIPIINYGLSKLNQKKLNEFLDLPDNNGKITYSVIYDFLSGLALSAFYISVCFLTIKDIYNYGGWLLAGIYLLFMMLCTFFIATMTLVRILKVLSANNKYVYYSAALILTIIANEVINVALKTPQ